MSKKKIIEVADVQFPPDSRIERSIKTLQKVGYSVDLLCLKNKKRNINMWGKARIYRLPFSESNFPPPLNWIVDYSLFTIVGTIYLYYLVLIRGYDIIHYNNPPDFMVPLLLPLKLFNKKIVYDAHEISYLLLESKLSGTIGKIMSKVMKLSQKLAVMTSDVVITVSNLSKRELRRMYSQKKIFVVENTMMNFSYKKTIKKNRKEVVFAYVGSFIKGRDIKTIIEAFNELDYKNVKLWLIGGKIKTSNSNIISFGKVPHKKALDLYQSSDVALVTLSDSPINRIGNPNRLYEAMALGKAIICSNLPGPKSILRDTGIYYKPGDVKSLKNAMLVFIKRPSKIKEYGDKARRLFNSEYTWNKIGKKLIDAYKSLNR